MKSLIARIFGITTAADAIAERDLAFQIGSVVAGELAQANREINRLRYRCEDLELRLEPFGVKPRAPNGKFKRRMRMGTEA